MRILLSLFVLLAFGLGCARVSVQAPKEPIKVDISMRLDIYQHIESDIDKIENMVTGEKGKGPQSFLNLGVTEAYADEGLSPDVQAAALRRKERRADLSALQAQGILGENRSGLVELRKVGASISFPINDENKDRMIIYRAVAEKNGTSIEEVQKLYAKRLQADAVSGTPIEVYNSSKGAYDWIIKN